jgi:glycosyltransferase involved in cell wall biosynthesis
MLEGKTVAVVVPAHDEQELIAATVQGIPGFVDRIFVVDDASDDATADIAHACGAMVLKVAHRHIAATRNAGAALAQGERLVFVDADTCVDEAVLRAAMQAMDDGAVGGGVAVKLQGDVSLQARLAAGFFALVGFAATFAAAAGATFFGAALPNAGFASFERAAIAGPAPAFAWVAFAGDALD